MEKLKGLLKQLGGSDELVAAINEEFSRYAQSIKDKYDREFRRKLQDARKVCLEEVNKEKAALARKVSVFLEAKSESIEKAAEKMRLNEETEATNTLKRVKCMLEGVEVNSGNSRELQASRKKIERLTAAIGTLKEERNLAVQKANDSNRIAVKALKDNRLLEGKLTKQGKLLSEDKTATKPTPKKDKVLSEERKPQKRLDSSRRKPQPSKSTRPTLVESQTRKGRKKDGPNSTIAGIAASIDEE